MALWDIGFYGRSSFISNFFSHLMRSSRSSQIQFAVWILIGLFHLPTLYHLFSFPSQASAQSLQTYWPLVLGGCSRTPALVSLMYSALPWQIMNKYEVNFEKHFISSHLSFPHFSSWNWYDHRLWSRRGLMARMHLNRITSVMRCKQVSWRISATGSDMVVAPYRVCRQTLWGLLELALGSPWNILMASERAQTFHKDVRGVEIRLWYDWFYSLQCLPFTFPGRL